MRCLLDTHTLLWAVDGSSQLSGTAHALLEDEDNNLFLSIASLWEIAIKLSSGKLRLGLPFLELATQKTAQYGVTVLAITPVHLDRVASLPFHHRDPFDRLMVAQCLSEGLPIVSRDGIFDSYLDSDTVMRLW